MLHIHQSVTQLKHRDIHNLIIIMCRHLSTLYGSRIPQSAPRVDNAVKHSKQRRCKGDLNAVCDRHQARADPLLFVKRPATIHVQVLLYWYTGPPLYVTIRTMVCHSPTVMSARLGLNEWGRENLCYLADSLAHKAITQSLPLAHRWLYCLWHLQ